MNDATWVRLAPLTGAASMVLFVAGMLVINNYDYLPPADEIRSFFEDGATRITVGGYVVLLSAFFLLWFLGSLRDRLRSAEGATGRLSAIAFAGGTAASTAIIVGGAAMVAGSQRGGTEGGIAAETATALFDLSGMLIGNATPAALAAVLGAAAVVSFRHGLFPRWLAWVTAIVAVGLLTPLNYIFLGVAALWILGVSIDLYRSQELGTTGG